MKTVAALTTVLLGALPLAATAADGTKPTPAPGGMTGQTPPSVTTPAELGQPEIPPMFKELDRDKDGQITREEAKRSAEITASFDSLDTDHNGKVSILEWNAREMKKPPVTP